MTTEISSTSNAAPCSSHSADDIEPTMSSCSGTAMIGWLPSMSIMWTWSASDGLRPPDQLRASAWSSDRNVSIDASGLSRTITSKLWLARRC